MENNYHIIPEWLLNSEYVKNQFSQSGMDYEEAIKQKYYFPNQYFKDNDLINIPADYKKITEIIGFVNIDDIPKTYINYTQQNTINAYKYFLNCDNAFIRNIIIILLDNIIITNEIVLKLSINLCIKWNINYSNNFYKYCYNNIEIAKESLYYLHLELYKKLKIKKVPITQRKKIELLSQTLNKTNLNEIESIICNSKDLRNYYHISYMIDQINLTKPHKLDIKIKNSYCIKYYMISVMFLNNGNYIDNFFINYGCELNESNVNMNIMDNFINSIENNTRYEIRNPKSRFQNSYYILNYDSVNINFILVIDGFGPNKLKYLLTIKITEFNRNIICDNFREIKNEIVTYLKDLII